MACTSPFCGLSGFHHIHTDHLGQVIGSKEDSYSRQLSAMNRAMAEYRKATSEEAAVADSNQLLNNMLKAGLEYAVHELKNMQSPDSEDGQEEDMTEDELNEQDRKTEELRAKADLLEQELRLKQLEHSKRQQEQLEKMMDQPALRGDYIAPAGMQSRAFHQPVRMAEGAGGKFVPDTLMGHLTNEAKEALWRSSATQAVNIVRPAVVAGLSAMVGKKNKGFRSGISALLETPMGESAIAFSLGLALTKIPAPAAYEAHARRLGQELRVKALASGFDEAMSAFVGPMLTSFMTLLQGLPDPDPVPAQLASSSPVFEPDTASMREGAEVEVPG